MDDYLIIRKYLKNYLIFFKTKYIYKIYKKKEFK